MYKTKAFAVLAGTTARTLHHYDRLGLLKPRARTAAGYRLYEDKDLERLEHIVALKFVGLSLKQIRTLLDDSTVRLSDALAVQRRLLQNKRLTLDRAIRAILEAESHLKATGAAKSTALRQIIEVIEMENNDDWMEKYQTEESRMKIEARKPLWSPELQERVSREWSELIADVMGALGENPGSGKAQALAARWKKLVAEFTGGDAGIAAGVGRMWQDRANWPKEVDQKALVIRPDVWEFINRAMAIRQTVSGTNEPLL